MRLENPRIPERLAAKTLLYTQDGDVVCVVGEHADSVFNLVGGGRDSGETAIEALYREVNEELGITASDMTTPKEIGGTWAEVPTSTGKLIRAMWNVHETTLLIPSQELQPRAEVTSVHIFSPEALLAHDRVSILAKQSLALSLGATNIRAASLNLQKTML